MINRKIIADAARVMKCGDSFIGSSARFMADSLEWLMARCGTVEFSYVRGTDGKVTYILRVIEGGATVIYTQPSLIEVLAMAVVCVSIGSEVPA